MKYIRYAILIVVCNGCSVGGFFDKPAPRPVNFIEPNIPSPVERISETLAKAFTKQQAGRIIVMSFTDTEGKPHRLGRILAEKLTTEIVKKSRASVLDRLMFEKTLQENNLSLTGSLDVTLSKKVGDILKVDAVIMGIIHPFGSGVDINCRVIDTRTGIILSAEEAYYPTGQDE